MVRVHRYLVDGQEASQAALAEQPFIIAGVDLPDEETAYGFSKEESFYRWAATTRHAHRFARAIGTIKLGQQLEDTDTASRAAKRQEVIANRLRDDLEELAQDTGLSMESAKFLITASEPRSLLEGAYFDPTILWDTVLGFGPPVAFGGPSFPVFAAIPTFFGFNDKASGAQVIGVCTLHDRTFFRGAAAFLIGAPGSADFVLSDIGWSDRAASAIAA